MKVNVDYMVERYLLCYLIIVVALFGGSCKQEQEETNTRGKLHVRIPESIAPVLIEEIQTFSSLYKESGADVTYSITTSENALREFLHDTLRICFSTIPLSDLQFKEAKSISPHLNSTVFAYDALVFVVNESNRTRQITTEEVKDIVRGKIRRWQDLSKSKHRGTLRVALKDSADLVVYLRSYFGVNTISINSWIRVQTYEEVFARLKRDDSVLGILPLGWWNEVPTDLVALEVARTSNVSTTFPVDSSSYGNFYSPHLAYIHLRYYPFYRPLYVYCRYAYGNVAAGFTTFVTHSEGQQIVRKMGLLPGTVKIVLK
ncbi:MAG: substrate-binding domain-containing protein [Bacteroidetes bacterium]|nr:substrate-binding domain-containing protein [Bacteroidota bacterium]